VTVFPLLVRRQHRVWPEYGQHKTKWVSLRKTASLVTEKELRALIWELERVCGADKLAKAVVIERPSR
jgi:hypothetical protein